MTPAETLAAKKKTRGTKGHAKSHRRAVWRCQLKELRTALRLTIREVAAAAAVTTNTVWQLEAGADPRLATAMKLAAFFGKTVEEIWSPLERLTPKEATGE